MESQGLHESHNLRRVIRPLLSPTDPADALASHYALWHDPRRTELTIHRDDQGQVVGFAAVCQTGADLFRPLVTLRAPDAAAAGQLLQAALTPNRPYRVSVPVTLAPFMREHLDLAQTHLTHIYRLKPLDFQPVVNVLVQRVAGADGSLRFQIESQEQLVAMSGTNWRSSTFAEVFVYVHPRGRGRGWGKSVVSACTAELIEARLSPLYMVEAENTASIHIAESLGYTDTGLCEFVGTGQLLS